MKEIRIFVGIYEVAGYFQNLFLGLIDLGYDVGYLNLSPNKFGYSNYKSKNYKILNIVSRLVSIKRSNNLLVKLIVFVYLIILRLFIFCWCFTKFDVFIFSSGKSFFNFYDCKLLKIFNKQIIFVSLGSDTRPAFINGKYKDDNELGIFNSKKCFNENNEIAKNVRKIEEHASYIINYPQHGHFHNKKFISGNIIGFPTNIIVDNLKSLNQINNGEFCPIKIIHAPTRPNAKGSLEFRKIINDLIQEGFNINYVELIGKANSEVLYEIQSCDIVLDEMYSDLPLGGLGSEAAMFAKPVVVSGYYSTQIKENKSNLIPPSCYSDPQNVKMILRKLVQNKKLRQDSGKKLQEFVIDKWSLRNVALKYSHIILGEIPEFWFEDPMEIKYLFGWGISKNELKQNMLELIDEFGIESLKISHNNKLVNRYINFISRI